jgi:dTDP-4-amino-4,6-dideoxygalactose transaminase
VATVAAVEIVGAVPVLVDIDPRTYTLAPSLIEAALTPRTKAIIPVHLYGHPADLQPILATAQAFGLQVIEDCAQAHGAEYHGKRVGSFGDAAAFSFYPTKNLGAVGDAGMVLCSRAEVARAARLLRQYGWKLKHVSEQPGYNMRLDELQAAILRVKLKYLDQDNRARRRIAERYSGSLKSTTLLTPTEDSGVIHSYHQYVIRHPERDQLRRYLADHAVGTNIHYPVPIHLQPAYRDRVALPGIPTNTEQVALEILSLPMYPTLGEAAVDYIIDTLGSWLAQRPN